MPNVLNTMGTRKKNKKITHTPTPPPKKKFFMSVEPFH
jgi:hypothetical protein